MFIVVYALDWSNQTQWLGLCLGSSLGLIAAALILAGEQVVPTEHLEEDYPEPSTSKSRRRSTSWSKRPAAGLPGGGCCSAPRAPRAAPLGAALVVPVASLGSGARHELPSTNRPGTGTAASSTRTASR